MNFKQKSIELYTPIMCPLSGDVCLPELLQTKDSKCRKCKDFDTKYNEVLKQMYMQNESGKPNSTYKRIQAQVKQDGGKYISIEGVNALLIGASMTVEDYYWIYMDKDMKLHLSSCVGSYKLLDEVPEEFLEIDKFRVDEESKMKIIIRDQFNKFKYDLAFTRLFH